MFIIILVANPEEKQTNPNVFLTPAKGFLDCELVKKLLAPVHGYKCQGKLAHHSILQQ